MCKQVFHIHWSLTDCESPHVSKTLLSILANFDYAVVWTVSSHPVISKSSNPCTYPLVTVLRAPITIGIVVIFMFPSFSNSLARTRYLSFFSQSLNFTLWSARTVKSIILRVLSPFFFNIIRSGRLADYYYYHHYLLLQSFFTSVLADGFSLGFE